MQYTPFGANSVTTEVVIPAHLVATISFSHRKTGTQSIRNSCMSADSKVTVSTQMGEGYYAFGFMQTNTARKICRGGDSDTLSGIDVLKNVSWVQTTPNAKIMMNTTNCEKKTSSDLCPIEQD